ncbi:MAG: hypothetical protein F4Y39_08555 [Gemmatimonadetes bacterium]|nr:hypothetical protein [Gemmatimonadota bacterium]MYK51704.1 hypothetical protein [Gemmatimonadota bacterium]
MKIHIEFSTRNIIPRAKAWAKTTIDKILKPRTITLSMNVVMFTWSGIVLILIFFIVVITNLYNNNEYLRENANLMYSHPIVATGTIRGGSVSDYIEIVGKHPSIRSSSQVTYFCYFPKENHTETHMALLGYYQALDRGTAKELIVSGKSIFRGTEYSAFSLSDAKILGWQ